jgi:hypothetical protein
VELHLIPPCPNGIKRDIFSFTLHSGGKCCLHFQESVKVRAAGSSKKLIPVYKLHGVISQKTVTLAFTIKRTPKLMHK